MNLFYSLRFTHAQSCRFMEANCSFVSCTLMASLKLDVFTHHAAKMIASVRRIAAIKDANEKMNWITSRLREALSRLYRHLFCEWILVGKLLTRSTRLTYFSTAKPQNFRKFSSIYFAISKLNLKKHFSQKLQRFAILSLLLMKSCRRNFATIFRNERNYGDHFQNFVLPNLRNFREISERESIIHYSIHYYIRLLSSHSLCLAC